MIKTPLYLASVLVFASLATASAAEPEPDWDATVKYLNQYFTRDRFFLPDSKESVSVSADRERGTLSITFSWNGPISSRTVHVIDLNRVDPNKMKTESFPSVRGTQAGQLYIRSLPSGPHCLTILADNRGPGQPGGLKQSTADGWAYSFNDIESADRTAKALKRAIALVGQADGDDPFATKPMPGAASAPRSRAGARVETTARRRKLELAILDIKDRISEDTRRLDEAARALDERRAESKKLADLRRAETDSKKRAVIITLQLYATTEEQKAAENKSARERSLDFNKGELGRLTKQLADLKD